MTDDDDNLLAAYDLSAWEAPPPPADLADAVVARAKEPASATPLETIERMNPRSNGRRRWWIAGAAVAVAAVALLVGVGGVKRTPKDGQGEVTAQAAQTLAIGPTTAALDPGTFVTWRRDKRHITVTQPRGSAMWNVADGDSLVIDAGAMVASVEASGASLRVEVEMIKATDARAIGISAATAIAVALVTIVVYEGAVKVRHDGEVVTVAPGSRYEVRPSLAESDPTLVGAKPPEDPRVKELEERIKELEAERDAKTIPDTCDQVSCVLNNYDGECCAKFKAQTPPDDQVPANLDRAAISDGIHTVATTILGCDTQGFTGVAKVSVKVAPSGGVTSARALSTSATLPAPLVTCIESSMRTAKFARTVNGGSFSYPFSYTSNATPPTPACDADALRKKGDDHLQTGMDAAALAAFEASMKCKVDDALYRRMLLAACRSKNARKAQLYYSKIPAADQTALGQMCIRRGIQVGETCDADALRQKGDDFLANGLDTAALVTFEKSAQCKPDPTLNRKIFLAACRSKNTAKAKEYFAKLGSGDAALQQLCIRNGIDPTSSAPTTPAVTGGVIKISSKPTGAAIFLDGVDTGKTTPATFKANAGRHKITLQVRGDRFTWAVTVKEGETTTFSKTLE